MNTYVLPEEIKVFGTLVTDFPRGVGDAFGAIMQKIPAAKERSYYGISSMDRNGKVIYYATAEEKATDESVKYGCQPLIIAKGTYLAQPVHNWRTKTDCIKDVFHDMMQDYRADNTKPCVEWYKNDDEMLCLLQTDPAKDLHASVDEAAAELMQLLLPLNEEQINTIPFTNSWTAAQLATHVTKSNNGMAQFLNMEGTASQRKPDERVKELKDTFLNFSIKLQSPDFIVPAPGQYNKDQVITSLKKSNERLQAQAATANLNDMINLPAAFGEITKLELLHFVLYHTQRHIHQLKKIIAHL